MLPWELVQHRSLGTKQNPGILNGAVANYNFYKSKEGDYFALGAVEMKYFRRLCEIFGLDVKKVLDMSEEEKFETVSKEFAKRTSANLTQMVAEVAKLDS